MNNRLTALIQQMPKGENHLHIEGSLSGATCFKLAKQKGITLPFASPEALDNYFFTHVVDLDSFLECYRLINALCVTDEDYYEAVFAVGEDAQTQNIIYRELMLDFPMTAAVDGAFGRVVTACHRAAEDTLQRYGIQMPLIVCVDRSQPTEDCMRYLRGFEPYLDIVDGIGLDYEEVGCPPRIHEKLFALAGEMGLYRTAHVQEIANMREALDILHCDRIDHGACAIEDAELCKRLADTGTLLTICPTSNVITGLYQSLDKHPLRALMAAGVNCSVNSDDPAFFGDLVTELERCAEQLNLTEPELVELARNSLRHSIHGSGLVEQFDAWYTQWTQRMAPHENF